MNILIKMKVIQMNNIQMKTNIQQLICIHDNDTNQDTYFVEKNNEWVKITQEEYDIIRGKK